MSAWLADALIGSALLIGCVLLIRLPVRRLFGARIAYALWALPALRLVLPPLPSWPVEAAPVTLGRETFVILVAAPETAPSFPLAAIVVAIWAAGAALLIAWQVVGYRRFTRGVLAGAEHHATVNGIRVVRSAAVSGPIAFGLLRRTVALPSDWHMLYDADERDMALAHEIAHHRRGDLFARAAALGVLALQWPNPLAWIALRAFRADQELATDAHVVTDRSSAEHHSYARAIVKAAGGRLPAAVCGLHSATNLKGRLRMLTRTTSRGRRAAGTLLLAGVTVGLLAGTASGGRAAETMRADVERATGVPFTALSPATLYQSAPDAPPAPPGPTAPGSGGRHVQTIRDAGDVRVTVTENGGTRRYEGAAAEAWLAANPQPVPPVPPVPPVQPGPATPPTPPTPPSVAGQARTIVVRPGAQGTPTLMIKRVSVAPGAPLPPNVVLPRDFDLPASCGSNTKAPPPAMVIKGEGGDKTYTVLCTRPAQGLAAGAEREAYRQALHSLRVARKSIAAQVTPAFPEAERRNALASVDASIAELEADLAQAL